MKIASTRIACVAVLGGVGWGAIATAQVTGPPAPITPDLGFIGQYEALRSVWFFTLFPLATALFWKLAALEMVLSGVLWVSSQQSFDAITGHLFRKIFWIGFSYAVLLYADTWIPAVIDSFRLAGVHASSLENLSPGSIFAQGLALAVRLLYTMSFLGIVKNIVGAVVGIVAALAIVTAYALIAIEMAITLVESYVVTGAGVFLLGFAAFRGTSGITERYLGYTIAVGLRLFVIHLLVGAGLQLAQGWADSINDTTVFDMATPLSIAGSALLFALLTWRIPKLAGALASGVTSLGVTDVFGVAGGAVRFAAMAVPAGQIAAGAMTIAQATSTAKGGGMPGMLAGISAGGGALAREVSAASVPRLHQAARRISAHADATRRPSTDTNSPPSSGS